MLNPLTDESALTDVRKINKPLYSLNFCQVLNHEEACNCDYREDYISFVAPEARILIVDDNEMNLKVATGLLEPLQMTMETADSGRRAIEMIQDRLEKGQPYHIIFMDHMMPVMDGVETTEEIRGMKGEYYTNVPIITLSANALMDARVKFKEAGMDDFVAKPIELGEICKVIKRWLPRDLVKKVVEGANAAKADEQPVSEEQTLPAEKALGNIDKAEGIRCCGTEKLWRELLGDFYKLIDSKSKKLEQCVADGLIRDYTIEVHALKNTSRMIGDCALSEWFHRMEDCGNAGDVETIQEQTPALLEAYRSYKPILEPFARVQNVNKEERTPEQLIELLQSLHDAADSFDLDTADAVMKELEGCRIAETDETRMDELRAYLADVALMEIMELTDAWMTSLKEG